MSTRRRSPVRAIDWPPMLELRRLYDLHGSWPKVARVLGVGHRALYAHAQQQEGRETVARLRAEVTRLRALVTELGGVP